MNTKNLKLTPWFPNSIKPVRVGVYEIRGSCFNGPLFRRWNGYGWSLTYSKPSAAEYSGDTAAYEHGQDMTGWRGIEK